MFRDDVPLRGCDAPGCAVVRKQDEMINFNLCIGSPGHWSMPPYQCLDSEHWACSFDCWEKVASECIRHTRAILQDIHNNLPGSVHRKA